MAIHYPSAAEMKARAARQRTRDAEAKLAATEARLATLREETEREILQARTLAAAFRQSFADILWRGWIEEGIS